MEAPGAEPITAGGGGGIPAAPFEPGTGGGPAFATPAGERGDPGGGPYPLYMSPFPGTGNGGRI